MFEQKLEHLEERVTKIESWTEETRRLIDSLSETTSKQITTIDTSVTRLWDRLKQLEEMDKDGGVTNESVQKLVLEITANLKKELSAKFDVQISQKIDVTTQNLIKIIQDAVNEEGDARKASDTKLMELIEQLRQEFEERSKEIMVLRSEYKSLTERITTITDKVTHITGQEGCDALRKELTTLMERLEQRISILERSLVSIRTQLTKLESMRTSTKTTSSSTSCRCLRRIRYVNGKRTESKTCTKDGVAVDHCGLELSFPERTIGGGSSSSSSSSSSTSSSSHCRCVRKIRTVNGVRTESKTCTKDGVSVDHCGSELSFPERTISGGSSSSSSTSSSSSSSSHCRCIKKIRTVNGERTESRTCTKDGVEVESCGGFSDNSDDSGSSTDDSATEEVEETEETEEPEEPTPPHVDPTAPPPSIEISEGTPPVDPPAPPAPSPSIDVSGSSSSSSSICRCVRKVHHINGERTVTSECSKDGVKVDSCGGGFPTTIGSSSTTVGGSSTTIGGSSSSSSKSTSTSCRCSTRIKTVNGKTKIEKVCVRDGQEVDSCEPGSEGADIPEVKVDASTDTGDSEDDVESDEASDQSIVSTDSSENENDPLLERIRKRAASRIERRKERSAKREARNQMMIDNWS